MSAHSIQTDSAHALPEMAPFLYHSLEPSLLLLQLNKPSFTSAPTMPVLPPVSEAAGASVPWERQHLKVKWSLYTALVPWGSTSRVQPWGQPKGNWTGWKLPMLTGSAFSWSRCLTWFTSHLYQHRREEGSIWKWVATEIHVKGALSSTTGYETMSSRGRCAQQSGRLKGRTGSDSLFHSCG